MGYGDPIRFEVSAIERASLIDLGGNIGFANEREVTSAGTGGGKQVLAQRDLGILIAMLNARTQRWPSLLSLLSSKSLQKAESILAHLGARRHFGANLRKWRPYPLTNYPKRGILIM